MRVFGIYEGPQITYITVNGLQYTAPDSLGFWEIGSSLNVYAVGSNILPTNFSTTVFNQDGSNNYEVIVYAIDQVNISFIIFSQRSKINCHIYPFRKQPVFLKFIDVHCRN